MSAEGKISPTTTTPVLDWVEFRIRSGYVGLLYGVTMEFTSVGDRRAGLRFKSTVKTRGIALKATVDRVFRAFG